MAMLNNRRVYMITNGVPNDQTHHNFVSTIWRHHCAVERGFEIPVWNDMGV